MISEMFRHPHPISSHNPGGGAHCCCPAEAGSLSFWGQNFTSNPKKGKNREKGGEAWGGDDKQHRVSVTTFSKPPADGTVLGTWPSRSKQGQNITASEYRCPSSSLSRSLNWGEELQCHPKSSSATQPKPLRVAGSTEKRKLPLGSSGPIGYGFWCHCK